MSTLLRLTVGNRASGCLDGSVPSKTKLFFKRPNKTVLSTVLEKKNKTSQKCPISPFCCFSRWLCPQRRSPRNYPSKGHSRRHGTYTITNHLMARTVRSPGERGKKSLEARSECAQETDILADKSGNIICA